MGGLSLEAVSCLTTGVLFPQESALRVTSTGALLRPVESVTTSRSVYSPGASGTRLGRVANGLLSAARLFGGSEMIDHW
jgi:hypothetical protein